MDILISKINAVIPKINAFNTEIEEVVYMDPALDKLSIITYYTLKTDQKLWDDFQNSMAVSAKNLKLDKVRIAQELTKTNIKKQKIKTPFNEGVVLSMYTQLEADKALEDSLKSPFTGVSYKEINNKRTKNLADSGFVIVSFVMPKPENDPMEAAGKKDDQNKAEAFSLSSARSKAELEKLKDKKFNRLIAHSNGATLVECLINDSLIGVKELNIIGGEKSLLNGQALQNLLDKRIAKRIVVWIKLNDPAIWISPLSDDNIAERTENFISYKRKYDAGKSKIETGKVEYKWILSNENLAVLNEQDPQFISAYFKEISKEFRTK